VEGAKTLYEKIFGGPSESTELEVAPGTEEGRGDILPPEEYPARTKAAEEDLARAQVETTVNLNRELLELQRAKAQRERGWVDRINPSTGELEKVDPVQAGQDAAVQRIYDDRLPNQGQKIQDNEMFEVPQFATNAPNLSVRGVDGNIYDNTLSGETGRADAARTATDDYNRSAIDAAIRNQTQQNSTGGGGYSILDSLLGGNIFGSLSGGGSNDDPYNIGQIFSPGAIQGELDQYVTQPPPPTSSQPPPTTTPPPGGGTTTPPPQLSRDPEVAYTQEQIADWDSWWQHSTQNVPNTTEGDAFKQTILNSSGNPLPGYDPKYWDDWNSPQDTFGNYYQGSPGFGGSINGSTTPLFSRDDPDFASYGSVFNPYTVLDLARITGKIPSEIAKLPVSERFRLAKEVYKLENPPNTPQYTPQLPTLRSGDLYNKYAPSTNNNIGSVITGLTNLFPDSSQPNQAAQRSSGSLDRAGMNRPDVLQALLSMGGQ